MTYNRTTWATGDNVTAVKLNILEDGIGLAATGVAATDTANIQASLDNNLTTVLGEGTFAITSAGLTVPTGCELRGQGIGQTVLQATGDYATIKTFGGEPQAIRDLTIANSFTGTRTTYDIDICNPYKVIIEHVKIALSQSALTKGGIRFYKDAGQPNSDRCFMPQLTDAWIANGVLVIDNVTDGKAQNCFFWGTYTAAVGTVQLTSAANWTFDNVDVVPPQGDVAGYLITDTSNLSLIGGMLDGSYDAIMTGHGLKSAGYVRGLSVMGVKFYNLGRSGIKISDIRRSAIIGNIFIQNNKADNSYADIDLTAAQGNTIIGNTHGAPNSRTNKGKIYVEDATSSDNIIDYNSMEYNGGTHFYLSPIATVAGTGSTLGSHNRPDVVWPFSGLLVKSSTYTATAADLFNEQTIHASGTFTITLPSAGAVHAGNQLPIKNTGTGLITVATVSSQTIDGLATSIVLNPGRAMTLMSTGSAWQIGSTKPLAPSLVQSSLATLATISATVWPTANLAVFQRISIPESRTYRYVTLKLDVSSGNYQLAVVRLSGSGLTSYDRVMNTGVVAAPTAGDLRVDLGATFLPAGDYAIGVWADNTTLQTRYATNGGVSSMRLAAETSSLATGIPSSSTVAWVSTRIIGGLGLEADI